MAGNRLHWTGSIFSRMSGLIEAGAVKGSDIPLWYDVYKMFPPKHEPSYIKPPVMKEILPIYYPEDVIRGKFTKLYGSPGTHDLRRNTKSIMQRFVEKYQELEKSLKHSSSDEIFKATEDFFINEGTFQRSAKNTGTSAAKEVKT